MYESECRYLAEQARNRSLVLFVGAGASQGAKLPGWKELLQEPANSLGLKEKDIDDYLDVAQYYADTYGRKALLDYVRKAISAKRQPGLLHRALAQVPALLFFTTNYDQLLESALEQAQGVPPDVVVEDSQVAAIDEGRRTTVVKLHGCLSLPETIVLASDDYETYAEQHRAMTALFQGALATRTFLFVGFSLMDPNIRFIHQHIRRALGESRRQAYLLRGDNEPWPEPRLTFWAKRGIRVLQFPGHDKVEEFVRGVAAQSAGAGSALLAAQTLSREQPPPPVNVGPFLSTLSALRRELDALVERGAGLEEYVTSTDLPPAASQDDEAARWVRDKARALLELASAVDRLSPVEDPRLWSALGDLLYTRGDAAGAIQAYDSALRPNRERRPLAVEAVLRLRGNLARAHAHEGQYLRAERLLRHCVYLPDRQNTLDKIERAEVLTSLNREHLSRRPTDASEFAYVLSRRAEQLRDGGHAVEAFEALREARYVLEPVLGVSRRVDMNLSFFALELDQRLSGGHGGTALRSPRFREQPSDPRAYAYNFLGKCYCLSYQLALDLRRQKPEHYLDRAVRYLDRASSFDPLLPFPYGHKLALALTPGLPRGQRTTLVSSILRQLQSEGENPSARHIVEELARRYPSANLLG